jgi:hypothetical protein
MLLTVSAKPGCDVSQSLWLASNTKQRVVRRVSRVVCRVRAKRLHMLSEQLPVQTRLHPPRITHPLAEVAPL